MFLSFIAFEMSAYKNRFLFVLALIMSVLAGAPRAGAQALCRNQFEEFSKMSSREAEMHAEIRRLKGVHEKSRQKDYKLQYALMRMIKRTTDYFRDKNGHKYPLLVLKGASAQKARLLAKLGKEREKEIYAEIEYWMDRYSDYKINMADLIERTVTIREEVRILEASKNGGAWPLELFTPQFLRRGEIIYHRKRFKDVSELNAEIDRIRKDEAARFDHVFTKSFKNRDYLKQREIEQAETLENLRHLLLELRRYPRALKNPALKHNIIDKAQALVDDLSLRPSVKALVDQAALEAKEEIWFFQGFGTSAAGVPINNRLLRSDWYELGLDGRRVGLMWRLIRNYTLAIPLQLFALTSAYVVPEANYRARVFFENGLKQEIVMSPSDAIYRDGLQKFIETKYGISLEKPETLTPQIRGEIESLKRERQEYLAEQAKVKELLEATPAEPKAEARAKELLALVKIESRPEFLAAAGARLETVHKKTLSAQERNNLEIFLTTKNMGEGAAAFGKLSELLGPTIATEVQQVRELKDKYDEALARTGSRELALLQTLAHHAGVSPN